MAASGRRASPAVIERLFLEPHRFEFFQAVRILESRARAQGGPSRRAVGYDFAPSQEAVRFRVAPALSYAAADVARVAPSLEPGRAKANDIPHPTDSQRPIEMLVSFLGLTGPAGVLPDHYTTLLIERMRANDFALRDFLDLFHHRTISLFYRAWEKTNLPAAYERARREGGEQPDAITQCLHGVVGLLSGGPRERPELPRDAFLFYGGLFSQVTRPAVSLERLATDFSGAPARILQFQGAWLRLAPEDQSRLTHRDQSEGQFNCLGRNVVVGERVWDVQGRFRLALGPVRWAQFRRFLPSGDQLAPLGRLVRALVGAELAFDVQLLLPASEAPQLRLGASESDAPRLGWNVWLRSGAAPSPERLLDDAVFEVA